MIRGKMMSCFAVLLVESRAFCVPLSQGHLYYTLSEKICKAFFDNFLKFFLRNFFNLGFYYHFFPEIALDL